MSFAAATFYGFSAIPVLAARRVTTTRNPVHAALWLVLCFFSAAAIWLLLRAEFLAIALVLVYVGAVMVLFLFVVMMLDVNFDNLRRNFRSYIPVGATVGALVLIEMAVVVFSSRVSDEVAPAVAGGASNTRALGRLLYLDYVYPFEIAAVVLLVAIIAAIALTLRQRKDSKAINPALQVHVRASDRLVVVPMNATQKAAPVVEAAAAEEGKKP